jgi:hypothetical protein
LTDILFKNIFGLMLAYCKIASSGFLLAIGTLYSCCLLIPSKHLLRFKMRYYPLFTAIPAVILTVITLTHSGCTSNKTSSTTPTDPVNAGSNTSSQDANAGDLPPELSDAQRFDPASTLDPKVVQESDFYQIKQSVEQNKAALDATWKEQDRLENSVKTSATQEEDKKAALLKAEEEERERQRQKQVEAFEKSKDQRAKDEKKAKEAAEKLPGISNEEVNWKGLED